jgi:hypothetical protein
VELEGFTRCSDSLLWKLMMSFYDRKGVSSWSQGIVPHFITSNAFIGRTYARVLAGFIEDCCRKKNDLQSNLALDESKPLYIIELGTGAGKFSFFMLKALNEMAETLSFPVSKIVYVMTDFTQENVNFWLTHPMLADYVNAGQLDFAVFDAVNDKEITLRNSGVTLSPDNPTDNPICVVANYLFDTLCHDIFQVDGGELKEGLVSVGSSREKEDDILDPEIIKVRASRERSEGASEARALAKRVRRRLERSECEGGSLLRRRRASRGLGGGTSATKEWPSAAQAGKPGARRGHERNEGVAFCG